MREDLKNTDYDMYTPKCISSKSFICYEIERIEHVENAYRITFKDPLLTQGVIMPDNIGFKPEADMKVIWDNDGSMGSEGYLSFYNQQGKQLCILHREHMTKWPNAWHNITPKSSDKEPEYVDKRGKLTLEGVEELFGKPVEELLKDPVNRESLAYILSDEALKKVLKIPEVVSFEEIREAAVKQFIKYGRLLTSEELKKRKEKHVDKLGNTDTAETIKYRQEFSDFYPAVRVLGNALLDTNSYSFTSIVDLKSLQQMIDNPDIERKARKSPVLNPEIKALDELRSLQKAGVLGEKFNIISPEKFKESPLVTEGLGISRTPIDLRQTKTMKKCSSSENNMKANTIKR